jgi:hypothetical protein
MNATFPYCLAAVDLDDTLLGPDKHIGAANRTAVRALQDRGVEVILASGRSVPSMVVHHRELGLDGLMVSLNGAVISRPSTGDLLRVFSIDPDAGSSLIDEGLANGFTVVACCAQRTFASARTSILDRYQSRGGERDVAVGLPIDLAVEGLLKLVWIAPPAALDAVQASVLTRTAERLNVIRTETHHLEFMSFDADKAAGLRAVAEFLGVPRERTLAVGDGPNDVRMLAWAGLGIAVGHAVPSAREAADLVGPEAESRGEAFAVALNLVFRPLEAPTAA